MMVLIVRGLIVIWATGCLVATHSRIARWGSEPALWADAAAHAPNKPRPWINLGRQYALSGDARAAEAAYRRGMAAADTPGRAPDERIFGYGIGAANVALLRCQDGDREGAVAVTSAALLRKPTATSLHEFHLWLTDSQPVSGRLACSPPVSSF